MDFGVPLFLESPISLQSFWGLASLKRAASEFTPENGWLVQMIRLPFGAKGIFSGANC